MSTDALRAECIALIRGAGGIHAAVEHAASALGISQTEARRWVHSLGAAKPEILIRPVDAAPCTSPGRGLADQLVGLGLLIQGEQRPDSPLSMVQVHVTEAGATAIDMPFVEPGSERPGAKPLVRLRRKRKAAGSRSTNAG